MIRRLYDRRERVVVENPKMSNKTSNAKPFFLSLFYILNRTWHRLSQTPQRSLCIMKRLAKILAFGRISLCIPYAYLFMYELWQTFTKNTIGVRLRCMLHLCSQWGWRTTESLEITLSFELMYEVIGLLCNMSALPLLLHWQKFKTASSRKLGQCYGMSQLSQVCLKALSQVLTLYISYFHSDVSTWKKCSTSNMITYNKILFTSYVNGIA